MFHRNLTILASVAGLALLGACTAPVHSKVYAGSVSGRVVFEGRAPTMRPIQVDADPGCAKMHDDANPLLTEFMVTGEGGTMANVIVRVSKGLPAGEEYPVPSEPVEVTQRGCQYSPHVFVARVGQPIRFTNPDGMQHNVHLLPAENRELNRAMSESEREFVHSFPKAEPPFRIKCDVHTWMEAYCAVLDNPFYAVTGVDGAFAIDGLPAGEYEVEAWHEILGTQTAKVKVAEGAPATIDFTFTRPQKKN